MQPTYESRSKTKLVVTVLTIIVVAGAVLLIDNLKPKSSTQTAAVQSTDSSQAVPTTDSSSTTDNTAPSAAPAQTSTLKDGTYTASTDYFVPHGNENIEVTLTLKGDVITGSTVRNSEGDPDSASFQEDFTSAYKSYVVGKKITDVRLGVVAGASDTSQAFNDALQQIVSKAQA
jgi:uncharacterized protein with FMN-binding domain